MGYVSFLYLTSALFLIMIGALKAEDILLYTQGWLLSLRLISN